MALPCRLHRGCLDGAAAPTGGRHSAGLRPSNDASCQSPAAPRLSSRLRARRGPVGARLRRCWRELQALRRAGITALALALAAPCGSAGAGAAGNLDAAAAGNPASGESLPYHLTIALPEGISARTIGFHLADDQGYFRNYGLAVDFVSDPAQPPSRLLADGKADLAVDLMPVALQMHQGGGALQHVAQFFQHSSLALYCRLPIAKPSDLHGTTIGVWFGGEESSFYAWMSQLNISTFGEEDGVTVLRQSRLSRSLGDARLDCVTSTSYQAPREMRAGGIPPSGRTVFRYEELGVGTLEDGLYARSDDLKDKKRIDAFTRFLAASIRGWQKLHDDRPAGLRLLRDKGASKTGGASEIGAAAANGPREDSDRQKDGGPDGNGSKPTPAATAAAKSPGNPDAADLAAMKASLDAVDGLVDSAHFKIGLLDAESYDRTVNLLLTGAPDPVLQGAPVAAVTDILWKQLRQLTGQAK